MGIDKDFRWSGKVNADLADKYSYWYGDAEKRVAGDISVAKRTRTQLANMAKTFETVVSAEQLLAIKASQSAVGQLIVELEALRPYFKRYARWKADKDERVANEKLDRLAAERWSCDAEAIAEAEDLVAFYAEGVEGDDVEVFILTLHNGKTRVVRDSCFSGASTARRELPAALKSGEITQIRRNAALVLNGIERQATYDHDAWWVVRSDYDEWLKHRLAARRKTLTSMTFMPPV